MRILLIANQTNPDAQVLQCLNESGFQVESISDPDDLLPKIHSQEFSAILTDLSEPSDGRLELIKTLRTKNIFTPVLGFRGSPENLVVAFDKGCDDYLGKSFTTLELLARLKALIRRVAYARESTTLIAGDIAMDLLKRQTRRGEKLIDLQPREFAMLEFMIRNQDRPLSKLMIMQNVWNYNFDPQTNIVDVLICRLRSKIETGFETAVIQTIRGVGYLFSPNVRE